MRLRRFDDAKAASRTGLARLDASSKIRARLLTGLATVHVRLGGDRAAVGLPRSIAHRHQDQDGTELAAGL